MTPVHAIIFDLGGTLVDWPDWSEAAERQWAAAYERLLEKRNLQLPDQRHFVSAMFAAELGHWDRVEREHWSGRPSEVIRDGLARLGRSATDDEILAILDAYADAVSGWAVVVPGARDTVEAVRRAGFRTGILSNTWWAAEWHDADLAMHGLSGLFDEVVYTSDLSHSKPHPSVFLEIAGRLQVRPEACVMVGDRLADDIAGALGVSMRAVWVENDRPWRPAVGTTPTATIRQITELPDVLRTFGCAAGAGSAGT